MGRKAGAQRGTRILSRRSASGGSRRCRRLSQTSGKDNRRRQLSESQIDIGAAMKGALAKFRMGRHHRVRRDEKRKRAWFKREKIEKGREQGL